MELRPLILAALVSLPALADEAPAATPEVAIEISGGSVSFHAPSNMRALSVHGESKAVRGGAGMVRTDKELKLSKLHLSIPVETLETGMAVRDQHMRERVFKMAGGTLPPVEFVSEGAVCALDASSRSLCNVRGELSIRGVKHAVTVPMQFTFNAQGAPNAEGQTEIHLSDYGIEAPKQFGVTMSNAVAVKFQLAGKPSAAVLSQR